MIIFYLLESNSANPNYDKALSISNILDDYKQVISLVALSEGSKFENYLWRIKESRLSSLVLQNLILKIGCIYYHEILLKLNHLFKVYKHWGCACVSVDVYIYIAWQLNKYFMIIILVVKNSRHKYNWFTLQYTCTYVHAR